MSSKLMFALFVTAILMASIVAVSIPAASALTSRSNFNDNHYTALYPGGPRICGDHICAPGEYDKMQQALAQAQMKGKGGSTAPSTPSTPPATTMPSTNATTTMPSTNATTTMPSTNATTTMPSTNATTTMPTMSVCQTVKSALTNAAVSSTVIAKVMADLGCS
jgi:hypothetical protein